MNDKQSIYTATLNNIELLIEGEQDVISVMSTIACELFHAFEHWNWVGFYRRVDESTLKVGPYQGGHGCLTIEFSRGVCGQCAREKSIQLHNDVVAFPQHIACSSETQAEIVLPILDAQGEVYAVLDIDSVEKNVFDDVDVEALNRVVAWVEQRLLHPTQ